MILRMFSSPKPGAPGDPYHVVGLHPLLSGDNRTACRIVPAKTRGQSEQMVRIRRGTRLLLAPELCAAGEEPLVQLIRSRAANGAAAWLIISRGATVAPMTKPAASGTVVTSHHLLAGLRAPSLRRRQAELPSAC